MSGRAAHRPDSPPVLESDGHGWRARFDALGGPCELLVDGDDPAHATHLAGLAAAEARRIEQKFSRYRDDGIMHQLNRSGGRPVVVDDETAELLDYAGECHAASDGRFDITSGVLRRAWTFDGGTHVPSQPEVERLLALVGWTRLSWRRPELLLPVGMELDLGGIGKEYAVDRAAARLAAEARAPFLVNFGGDLYAPGPRRAGVAWSVGIDDPEHSGGAITHQVALERGGLATSGDARRFVRFGGRRLGHILDPRTGWPVEGAPHSVTVLAASCLEAGTLATFAMLHGAAARAFLMGEGAQFSLT